MLQSSSPDAAPVWFIALGASGGDGLQNIKEVLHAIGRPTNAVVMIVLHRPFERPSVLRDVLQTATAMPVIVADEGEKLEPGCCYIGEPAAHLTLMARSYGELIADTAQQYRNRTVDLLFTSVAAHAGGYAVGVVLSGALDDGSRGLEAIHRAGGKTMVLLRDPGQPGMPENAIAYDGPVDCVGSTQQIADAILVELSSAPAARP